MNIAAESPSDELTGGAAIDAIHDALLDITGEPRVRFSSVKDIQVRKVGRWVILKVKSKGEPNELIFRINRAWATVAWQRLGKVLGK